MKKKYYVIIDEVETWFDEDKKNVYMVEFSIYEGETKIMSGNINFDYDDETTELYISDIEDKFREIGLAL